MAKNDGSGHYYRGDKRVDITWGDKISVGVKRAAKDRETTVVCEVCGSDFLASRERAKYCSPKCRYKNNYTDLEPIQKKAAVLGANLLMGAGKRDFLVELILNSLDKPCEYCREILTIDIASVDHIEAYGNSKDRKNKAFRQHMDRRDNLQIICASCNGSKGDFDHKEYAALLGLDDKFPGIVRKILRRLRQSKLSWGRKRGRGQIR